MSSLFTIDSDRLMYKLRRQRFTKYNHNHDELGRFSEGPGTGGGVSGRSRSPTREKELNGEWQAYHAAMKRHLNEARRGLKRAAESPAARANVSGHLLNAISQAARYPSNDERTKAVVDHLIEIAHMANELKSPAVQRNLTNAAGHLAEQLSARGLNTPKFSNLAELTRLINRMPIMQPRRGG